MTLEYFDKGLHKQNAVQISDKYKIWNDYDLWIDIGDDYEKHQFSSIYEIAEAYPDVKKIIEDAEDFYIINFK